MVGGPGSPRGRRAVKLSQRSSTASATAGHAAAASHGYHRDMEERGSKEPAIPGGSSRPLPPAVRAFLDAPRFATVATIDADGSPRQAVTWYHLTGDGLVINSRVGRRWPANLTRDPRISVAVEDGYDNVILNGRVEIVDDQEQAQADIAEMACRYHAADPEKARRLIEGRFRRERRISFIVRAEAVHAELEEG